MLWLILIVGGLLTVTEGISNIQIAPLAFSMTAIFGCRSTYAVNPAVHHSVSLLRGGGPFQYHGRYFWWGLVQVRTVWPRGVSE
jgi:hypothetical protein